MKTWLFEALDTLLFRDAVPFRAGETHRAAGGVFPPYATTIQGAVRTAIAARRGWSPGGVASWPEQLGGPDDLGDLILRGPYLERSGTYLFRAPLLFLGGAGEGGRRYVRLVPGREEVLTDLGRARLPEPVESFPGGKIEPDLWVTRDDLELILQGGVPRRPFSPKELWAEEPRVGIGMYRQTRTAERSLMYNALHVRPLAPDGDRIQPFRLAVGVDGIPEDWHPAPPFVVNLGGEGRAVRVEVGARPVELPGPPREFNQSGGHMLFTLSLLTPARFDCVEEVQRAVCSGPVETVGRPVSACVGRIERLGGWDLVKREPRPLEPVIPAGSTWFYEGTPADLDRARKLHGQCIGPKKMRSYGFGQVVVGTWKERGDG